MCALKYEKCTKFQIFPYGIFSAPKIIKWTIDIHFCLSKTVGKWEVDAYQLGLQMK